MNDSRNDLVWPNEVKRNWCDLLEQAVVKIDHCLDQLDDDQVNWRPIPSMNSIANLIVHICGNLRQWGIAPLTSGSDERDREAEFAADCAWDRSSLRRLYRQTVSEAQQAIDCVPERTLMQPMNIQGFDVNGLEAVTHTVAHFVGHTHQVILMTRLQLGERYRFAWCPDQDRGVVPL